MDEKKFGQAIINTLELLTTDIISQQFAAYPEIFEKFTESQKNASNEDTRYNLMFLNAALRVQEPNLFYTYLLWLGNVLQTRKVPIRLLI